ncbi:Vitamin B12 import ATP-binding protein BtuD [Candidatus Methanoperedenaceae archaeon GB50]|nr:Vitamin B12 import ATP-binding protein BtuD [Candidatus Methanoperedenaceae archaeon GB50]
MKCSLECIKYCPRVRTGDETIVIGDDGKPVISEELCAGCGICVKKCPFNSIQIIGLPEELAMPTHRYGENGFALYGLPLPQPGKVTGILGANGIGKTTAIKILSGTLIPNLGMPETTWDRVLEHYSGTVFYEHFKGVSSGRIKTSEKPQYVDLIPRAYQGKVSELLAMVDERGLVGEIAEILDITRVLDDDIRHLSGGELQRVAITACLAKDADLYFLDEITPYLDIHQRMKCAQLIREVAEKTTVLVVEHDLAILDLLADTVHISYGTPGAYGVITQPKAVRVGINEYLRGYLPQENVRIREEAIEFERHAPRTEKGERTIIEFDKFSKKYEKFTLTVEGGQIRDGEVVGIVGPNGIGKTTFIKLLAGEITPTTGRLDLNLKISYKPQYIKTDINTSVQSFLLAINPRFSESYYTTEIIKPLRIETLYEQNVQDLSGGELQRVAIAACLGRDADLYLFDEPSAHLDVEERTMTTRVIRRFAKNQNVTTLVADHDIYMIDMISDRLLVFNGRPGRHGVAEGPYEMRNGMNRFLQNLGITFRRDPETKRPRVNKPDSKLDREQRKSGEYYYTPEE